MLVALQYIDPSSGIRNLNTSGITSHGASFTKIEHCHEFRALKLTEITVTWTSFSRFKSQFCKNFRHCNNVNNVDCIALWVKEETRPRLRNYYVHALLNYHFKIDNIAVENKQNIKYNYYFEIFIFFHHVDSNCENFPATVAF
jgi:hypothetical protein